MILCSCLQDLSAVSMITMQLSNHLREMGASHTTIGYICKLVYTCQISASRVIQTIAFQ